MSSVLEKLNDRGGNDKIQILAVLIASSQGFTSGALSSWSSPFIVKISQDKVNYNVTEEEASLFAVFNNVGLIITPFLVPLVDIMGRKNGLLCSAVPYLLSWIIKAVATNIWAFYFARLLVGIADAMYMICIPMYVGEVSNPKVRGSWGNAFFLFLIIGSFFVNLLGIYCSVTLTSIFFISIEVVCVIMTLFIPESPYFYIANNREEEAKQILKKLTQKENVDEDFSYLKADVKRQLGESGTWLDLIRINVNRRALRVTTFLRTAQICSGVFLFGSYIQFIFYKSGSTVDANTSTIIYTALNMIIYSLAAFVSHRLGRRKSLIFSLIGTSIAFFSEFIYFFIEKKFPEISLKSFQWFPLVGLIIFLIFSSFGIGPVPLLMLQELFSAGIKSKAISLMAVYYGIVNLALNNVFYYLNSYTGLSGPFFMFAISNVVALVVSYYIIPETRNKTLEEIQQILKKNKNT